MSVRIYYYYYYLLDDEPIVNNYLMLNLRAALDTSALVSISHEAN